MLLACKGLIYFRFFYMNCCQRKKFTVDFSQEEAAARLETEQEEIKDTLKARQISTSVSDKNQAYRRTRSSINKVDRILFKRTGVTDIMRFAEED